MMVCCAQLTQLSLTIGFASMLLLNNLVMAKYEREAEHVLQYVKVSIITTALIPMHLSYF